MTSNNAAFPHSSDDKTRGMCVGHMRTPQTQVASRISELTGNVELFHPCRVCACSPGRGSCALTLLLIHCQLFIVPVRSALSQAGLEQLVLPDRLSCLWLSLELVPLRRRQRRRWRLPVTEPQARATLLSLQHSQGAAQKCHLLRV